jgi:hypothetical protein
MGATTAIVVSGYSGVLAVVGFSGVALAIQMVTISF